MRRRILTVLCALALLICVFAVAAAAVDANTVATIGITPYSNLETAISQSNGQLVKLEDNAGSITVEKDAYIDLNGHSITSANVTNGTLYCMDSQTDDYTIDDGNGYGKIGMVSGNVAGLAAESALADDGYLMVAEGENGTDVSFHRVNLRIYEMVLRGSEVGAYYKCDFEGDRLVADNVEKFGIALSVEAIPNEDNLDTECGYSYFTDFKPGAGANTSSASTLLYDVMDETLPDLVNTYRANLPIYGRAYLLTKDGYVFGEATGTDPDAPCTFKWLTQQADKRLTSKDQVADTVWMYKTFSKIMAKWELEGIESALCLNTKDPLWTPEEGKDIKVLAITSSFGLNTTQLLYDVIMAEAEAQGITLGEVTVARLYTSGCTLEKHITYAPNKSVYQYTKVTNDANDPYVLNNKLTIGKMTQLYPESTENGASLLTGLLDEEWDIIFMQQGARQAALLDTYTDANGNDYITKLRDIMKPYVDEQCPDARFVWNMLWAFENGSQEYPFNTTFNSNQTAMYQANVDAVTKYVVPRTDYDRIIPTGTVLQNARTSAFGDTLCKDSYHLDNRGGVVAAYGLYAVITGQELTEINLNVVSSTATNGIAGTDFHFSEQLSEKHKLIILESINNALKKPFEVTASQYPPVDYSDYNYTDDLKFFGDSKIAVCPACRDEATWIEINQENVQDYEVDANGNGYFGAQLATGNYHFYLSEDIRFTAANSAYAFLYSPGGGRNICLHLNGNDLTATNCAVSVTASSTKVNIMGTGNVCGNASAHDSDRGATLQINTAENGGTLNLYSGTFTMAAGNKKSTVISVWQQGGKLNIHQDAKIIGNGNHTIYVNRKSTGTTGVVTITGADLSGGDIYFDDLTYATPKGVSLIMNGGSATGVTIMSDAAVTLSGAPKISNLALAAGVAVSLGELTDGAEIAVDATGAFTVANSKAADYLRAGYFKAVQPGFSITEENGVLSCTQD